MIKLQLSSERDIKKSQTKKKQDTSYDELVDAILKSWREQRILKYVLVVSNLLTFLLFSLHIILEH